MQLTPNRGIPYYEPGDPADLAYITQAQATKLDALLVRRVWHQSYASPVRTNGQTVVTFTPGALPAGRFLIDVAGQCGYSGSANQRVGLSIASTVGTPASAQASQAPPLIAAAGEWGALSWAGYVDLPAGGTPTITLAALVPTGGSVYYLGEFIGTFLQLGEY